MKHVRLVVREVVVSLEWTAELIWILALFPLTAIKYLLDLGDKAIESGFGYRPNMHRRAGTSPYDLIDRNVFAVSWPIASSFRMAEIVVEDATSPAWIADRPAPEPGYSWVAASMVETVKREMRLERCVPSSHGFLGRLGLHGAYVVAGARPVKMMVEHHKPERRHHRRRARQRRAEAEVKATA